MQKANSLEKTLMLKKIEDKRRREQHRMRWLDSIPDTMDMSLSKLQDRVKDRAPQEACLTEERAGADAAKSAGRAVWS